jgi:molybdenum cofactor cytidylyltransferase
MPAPDRKTSAAGGVESAAGGPVAGVVLAAGTSTRMGRNKLLLELEGESLVRRAVRVASAAGLDPVIVVLGHEADQVRAQLDGLRCLTVFNPQYAEGVRTSLQAGVGRAAEVAGAFVVVLADMPYVTGEMIATVVRRYRATGAHLVVSQYGPAPGVDAPPILYDGALYSELLTLEAPYCAKRVVRRHRTEAEVVVWREEALRDIDLSEDYERARAAAPADRG